MNLLSLYCYLVSKQCRLSPFKVTLKVMKVELWVKYNDGQVIPTREFNSKKEMAAFLEEKKFATSTANNFIKAKHEGVTFAPSYEGAAMFWKRA